MPPSIVSIRTCAFTFCALVALLGATVIANFVDLGPFNVAAALAISIVKMTLIGLFFMEIRYSKPMTWLFAGAAFAWLLIMIGLTMNDYNTRPWSRQVWKDDGRRDMHMEFVK